MRGLVKGRKFLALFFSTFLSASLLSAGPAPQLKIRAAETDCGYGQVTLHGEFGDPTELIYVLELPDGSAILTPLGFGKDLSGSDFVDLALPPTGCEPPGTYRLTVGLKSGETGDPRPPQFYTVLDVTLGAVGREGPRGPGGERGEMGLPGNDGVDGTDGLNCWDVDADPACDLENEDLNKDGTCSKLDCAGAACWDLDQDLVCDISPEEDPQNEDKNADGICNPRDCAGTQGAAGADGAPGRDGTPGLMGLPGLPCWDLNTNALCDPEEDLNGSNGCEALDCKGPSGPPAKIEGLDDLEGVECSRDGDEGAISVFVDPLSGKVTLSCDLPEICDDGNDDDGDGIVDCADSDCISSAVCASCADDDGDSFFALDPACSGGNDCDDGSPATFPGAPEFCDGIDNDCNVLTLDGFAQAGALCDGPDSDLCREGNLTCTGGSLICSDATAGNVEVCDVVDNDCNGIFNDVFGAGTPCDSGELGACFSQGTLQCSPSGPALVCSAPIIQPHPEVCDAIDNDCDGQVDEGNICPPPDDIYEDNDFRASARRLPDLDAGVTRTLLNLTMSDDNDWYVFDARESSGLCFPGTPQRFTLTVEIVFTHANGDLDLQVIVDGQTLNETGATNNERLVLTYGGTCGEDDDKEFLVRVIRVGSKFNPDYGLVLAFEEE